MATQQQQYYRPPGPQNPGKYRIPVGPNYLTYGEQPGYVYVPQFDKYYLDPKGLQQSYEDAGIVDKKKQDSLTSSLLPIAAVTGATVLTTQLAKEGTSATIGAIREGLFGKTPLTTAEQVAEIKAAQELAALKAAGATKAAGTSVTTTTPTAATSAPANEGLLGIGSRPVAPGGGGITETDMMPGGQTKYIPGETQFGDPIELYPGDEIPGGYEPVGVKDGNTVAVPKENIDADGSVNWGRWGQGAVGAVQLYQGYQAYKQGNMLGAGLYGAAGAANAASALGYGSTSLVGGETIGSVAPVLGAVAGAYGLYDIAKNVGSQPAGGKRNTSSTISGAASGAAIGSVIPGVGTALGAGIGALYGLGSSYFGSDKDKYQMIRDAGREGLQKAGILDAEWKGTLADGTKFDFGKDGKGLPDLNYEDPVTGKLIALGNVISSAEGMYGRGTDAMTMLYTTAALSNAGGDYEKGKANLQHFAQQRGFTLDGVRAQLKKMLDAGQIDQHQFDVYSSGAGELLGGAPGQPVAPSQQPQQPQPGAPQQPVAPGSQPIYGQQPQPQPGQAPYAPPQPTPGQVPPAPPVPIAPQPPPRSSTLSPGIGMDGRPIYQGAQPGAVPQGANGRAPLTPEQQEQIRRTLAARGGTTQGLLGLGAR